MVTAEFHEVLTVALVAGANNEIIRPDTFGTSITALSDGYDLFKCVRFSFRIFALTTSAIAGVVSSVPNTLPTTIATVSELLDSVYHLGPQQTGWSEWVRVNGSVLAGPYPWYHTRAGTFLETESVPATLVLAGSSTNTVVVEVRGTFTFKDPLPTSSTPSALLLRARAKQEEEQAALVKRKAELLKVLSYTPPVVGPAGGVSFP